MSARADTDLLRRAIAIAKASVVRGGRPFGAIVCNNEGSSAADIQIAPVAKTGGEIMGVTVDL